MNLLGLDLNATRMLAVGGPAGTSPRPLPLDGKHTELPVAVSLEKRRPEAGRAAVGLCRRLPHLACVNFLPHLGESRTWKAGRHRLNADKALSLVLERLRPVCAGTEGLAVAVPAYLGQERVGRLTTLAGKARLPVLGTAAAPLALAWAAHAEEPWSGLAMVGDVDDHALTWTAVAVNNERAAIVGERTLAHLGLRAWKSRLIDAVAERCVRQSRRDPRDSAPAEQMLYEQLDAACESCRQGGLVELVIQSEHWFQHLMLRPEEVVGFCTPLARQAAREMQALDEELAAHDSVRTLLITASVGRLPGLLELVQESVSVQAQMILLPAEAAARATHELAACFWRGELSRGHIDVAIPLPRGPKADHGSHHQRAPSILRSGF
ncbi:MAG TPA: hypothetical protein VG013_16420 [Gemmataceae bacterium]|nr:hypothetical protein [Gemmataceae bacterium]